MLLIQKKPFHQKGTAHKHQKTEKICMWFKTRCARINDFTVVAIGLKRCQRTSHSNAAVNKNFVNVHKLVKWLPNLSFEAQKFGISLKKALLGRAYQGVYFILVLWADYLERSMHSDSDWIWFGLPEKWVITIGFLSPVII